MYNANDLPMRTEQNTVCFSGHRHLYQAEIPRIHALLKNAIWEYYRLGYRWFICGGALGFDTAAALEVIEAKKKYADIGLFLAIPCEDQPSRWENPDRIRYRQILDRADEKIVLSERYYNGCMHLRNQFMVQHSTVCICWLRRFTGGTGYTVRYALSCQKKVINLCIPEQDFSVAIKEPSWSCTFTFPSVCANALIARSIPFPAVPMKKWRAIPPQSSGRRRCANQSSGNP